MIENLNDLRYFLEVAKTGNITRASERLGVTQPSLTTALKRLEEKTGMILLERSQRGSQLTRQGEGLVAVGERMLLDWERQIRTLAQGQKQPIGQYSIGVHLSVALYTSKYFVPDLLNQFSELELNFHHDLSRKITEQVISRECDLGLVINPLPHPDLVITKLLTDEVTLFKHPAYKGDALILDPSLKQSQTLLKNIKKAFDYKREVHSSSLEVIAELCENKAGMAILPSRVAARFEKIKAVTGAPVFKDELCLIYRMERKQEESLKEIMTVIKKGLSAL